MENGIYRVQFTSSTGEAGHGLVVVQNKSFNGGDLGYIYRGRAKIIDHTITCKVQVSQYDASQPSLFSPRERFFLELSGTLNHGENGFNLSGTIVGQPQLQMLVVGKKVCNLAARGLYRMRVRTGHQQR